jgi:hypothetical protein
LDRNPWAYTGSSHVILLSLMNLLYAYSMF